MPDRGQTPQVLLVPPLPELGVPRISVITPLAEAVAELNFQPGALIGYASVLGTLADEQLEGSQAQTFRWRVDVVGEIEREPGPAAKVKLVRRAL